MKEYKNVWVFAENRDGIIHPVVFELLGAGANLAKDLDAKLCAVLLGKEVSDLSGKLAAYGAEVVYVAEDELLSHYSTEGYTKVIADLIQQEKPEICLFGATHIGRDLAPRIAARLDTGLTADCTQLAIDPGTKLLMQTRPAFGGNLMATILCEDKRPQMSTVRPGVMQKMEPDANRACEVVTVKPDLMAEHIRTKLVELVKTNKEIVNLTEAEFIISGGKGLGTPEGFELLKDFANAVGGAVGASRAAVDAGWIDKSHQVGQTGVSVKPKIYIACGISGAIQHLAGMQNSDLIIAINKNEFAPIFNVAHYGIVGDLYTIVPILKEEILKLKNM